MPRDVVTALPSQVYVTTAASPAIGHANVLTRSVMAVVVAAVVVVGLEEVEVVMVVLLDVGTVAATINALGLAWLGSDQNVQRQGLSLVRQVQPLDDDAHNGNS